MLDRIDRKNRASRVWVSDADGMLVRFDGKNEACSRFLGIARDDDEGDQDEGEDSDGFHDDVAFLLYIRRMRSSRFDITRGPVR